MRIVIDLYGIQPHIYPDNKPNDYLSLIKKIVINRGENEILLALSNFFPESIDIVRGDFHSILSQNQIHVWHQPWSHITKKKWKTLAINQIHSAFLESMQADVIHFHTQAFEKNVPFLNNKKADSLIPTITTCASTPQVMYSGNLHNQYIAPFECGSSTVLSFDDTFSLILRRYHDVCLPLEKKNNETVLNKLLETLSSILPNRPEHSDLVKASHSIALNQYDSKYTQLFVDITGIVQDDLKTGIQRVTRAILIELISNPPAGFIVEPVYATPNQPGYRYARRFKDQLRQTDLSGLKDGYIEPQVGDIFLGLDFQAHIVNLQEPYLLYLRRLGVTLQFVVHDLLPLTNPEWFPENGADGFEKWLRTIVKFDGAVCVSRATADKLKSFLENSDIRPAKPFHTSVSHNGADIQSSLPSSGLPDDANTVLKHIESSPTFLMVGTIEPRKGYGQALKAFELFWQEDANLNLVIVGKKGWAVDGLIRKIEAHPQLNKKLFWLPGISDEYLERIYSKSACLIAASEDEGFGLPLIEAAQYHLPIIARDIPIFREVANSHAYYFNGKEPSELMDSIQCWLRLFHLDKHPQSNSMPWLTWQQSANNLSQILLEPL